MITGGTLVVAGLDQLSYFMANLMQMVGTLGLHGLGFKSLHEALDTTTPAVGWSSTSSPRRRSSPTR
jgi:hypothetical protein